MNSDELKEIFETINDISLFLSLTNGDNLIETDIEKIFFKCHYIEQFVFQSKMRNLFDVFEMKVKEYFKMKKRIVSRLLCLDFCLDEALIKVITLQTSNLIAGSAIKRYLSYCTYRRFEDLVKKLSETRSLYLDVSHQLKGVLLASNVQHILLAECWLKIINSGEEGLNAIGLVVNKMFLDSESTDTLIKILCLDGSGEYRELQSALVNIITSELCNESYLSSWKQILESELIESLISKFSGLLEAVLTVLEIFGNNIKYQPDSHNWVLSVINDFHYEEFISVFRKISNLKVIHYKLKKVVYVNKMRGNKEIWEHIEKKVYL